MTTERRRRATACRCSPLCLPFDQGRDPEVVVSPAAFRRAVDGFFRQAPELFPDGFAKGYLPNDRCPWRKLGLLLCRVRLKATGETPTVRSAFALPSMAGTAAGVSGTLFLRAFAVPFWAPARLAGSVWAARAGVGAAVQLPAAAPTGSAGQRPLALPGGAAQRPSLP